MPEPELPPLPPIRLQELTLDIQHYLTAEYDDISQAAQELPAAIEWANVKLHELLERRLIDKQRIKSVEGKVYFEMLNGLFDQRGYHGKMTNAAVEHAVAMEPEVVRAHETYAITHGWCVRLQNLMSTLQTKLDIMRSVEATRRKAFDPDNERED